jgi:DNA-binding NtrC family response regulator
MSTPLESINKRHLRAVPPRIKRVRSSDRLERIRDLASELLDHSEALKHETEMADTSATIATLDTNSTIDFFEEVRRFEVQLIRRALKLGGSQVRAARLLGLETTTLNHKVKKYGLQ